MVTGGGEHVTEAVATHAAAGASEHVDGRGVARGWAREYEAVVEGRTYRSLRECAVRSLATVMTEVSCPGDPASLYAVPAGRGTGNPTASSGQKCTKRPSDSHLLHMGEVTGTEVPLNRIAASPKHPLTRILNTRLTVVPSKRVAQFAAEPSHPCLVRNQEARRCRRT
jgi:hypothetical protein